MGRTGAVRRALALAGALLLAGTACADGAPAGGAARAAPGAGEIRIVVSPDLTSGGIAKELIEEAAGRLGLAGRVSIVELPDDSDGQRSQLVAALQAGNRDHYDIVNLDVTWTAEFARQRLIEPLEGELAGLDTRDEKGIWQSVRDTVEYDGKAWAVPWKTDAGLLYYRADKLEDDPGLRTWRQLVGTVRRYEPSAEERGTLRAGLVTQLDSYEGLTVNTHEAVWRNGGEIVGEGDDVRVAAPEARRGLHELGDAFDRDGAGQLPVLDHESLESDETRTIERFLAGEALAMRNWPFAISRLEEHLRKSDRRGSDGGAPRYGVTALPDGDGAGFSGNAVQGGYNLAIAEGSPDAGHARRLIEEITSDGDLTRRLYEGGSVPARKSAIPGGCSPWGRSLPDEVPRGTLREQYDEALCWSMEHARARPSTSRYAAVTRDIQDVMTKRLRRAPGEPPVDEHATPGDLERLLRKSLAGR
ncbi:extracellular solute-binding protein [Streptomyces armeniacus]|uniref:Extracellular solute-binding protein n=1 Tax=Streptomyces armeniacus TaxID=83291 RepID=A0A345XPZ3_9ACTN|nr:extracellular solute-binding protein [Streptomyces armeniacus]AXK33709.1 extracellular solute-binding protein [Streptomyces armeniacus]